MKSKNKKKKQLHKQNLSQQKNKINKDLQSNLAPKSVMESTQNIEQKQQQQKSKEN